MSKCVNVEISISPDTLILRGLLRNESNRVLRLRPVFDQTDVEVVFSENSRWMGIASLQSFRIGPLSSIPLAPTETLEFTMDMKEQFNYCKAGQYLVWIDYDTRNRTCFFGDGEECSDVRAISSKVTMDIPESIVNETPYSNMSVQEYFREVRSRKSSSRIKRVFKVLGEMFLHSIGR